MQQFCPEEGLYEELELEDGIVAVAVAVADTEADDEFDEDEGVPEV